MTTLKLVVMQSYQQVLNNILYSSRIGSPVMMLIHRVRSVLSSLAGYLFKIKRLNDKHIKLVFT